MPQFTPITIERNSPTHAEVRPTLDGVALIIGDGVWVSNYLFQPEHVDGLAPQLQQAAIQCRAMRAQS